MELFSNPPGRAESFVNIRVRVGGDAIPLDQVRLDRAAKRRLASFADAATVIAVRGIASLAWKSREMREKCIRDHEGVRRSRWDQVMRYADMIRAGQFENHGHVYLHPSVTGENNLTVIDGTRRMLAHLEAGVQEMDVIVLRAAPARQVPPDSA